MIKKIAAEFVGTFVLVLFGCGAVVLAGFGLIGQLGIALAFGLAIVAMAYGLGPVSGCHVNPAVSFGAFVAGRMKPVDMLLYWAAQFAGAIVGAGVLYVIAKEGPDFVLAHTNLGANGYGIGHSPGDYSMFACFVFETVATFVFLLTILGVAQPGAPNAFATLAIGLCLTLIHIVGIQITGVSVNPARSLGPALWVGPEAIGQLWLFFAAPLLGAGLAGLAFRVRLLSSDEA